MTPFSINIRGRLHHYDIPAVMGIINITPDSFYAGSRAMADEDIAAHAIAMIDAGADILDLGAYSSRPGAADVSASEEAGRLRRAIAVVRSAVGDDVVLSVDTFRAAVAEQAIADWGADIVNDISGGTLDPQMYSTVARLHCPYILMHMRGTPATMQQLTTYSDVTSEVISDLSVRLAALEELGVADVIIDPGFGFAKTTEQNWQMLSQLKAFGILERPILVGISRKSMITKLLDIKPEDAATPTAVACALAIERGASIVRVHDVRQARHTISIVNALTPRT